jgi:ketosteroid isomerase-like protein
VERGKTQKDNVATVERLYAAVAAGDKATLDGCLHDDVVAFEADNLPYPGKWQGRAAFHDLMGKLFEIWDEFKVRVDSYIAEDDKVAVVLTFTAIHKPSGKAISMDVVEYWELKDARVKVCKPYYFDTHAIAKLQRA